MHRTRTKFAARAHRVASGLERRGVVATYQLHDRVLANAASRRRFGRSRPTLDETQGAVLASLRSDGYATLPLSELVPGAWEELEPGADRFIAETEAGLAAERAGSESNLRRREGKEFVVRKYS